MPFLRVVRDKRGYETTYLLHLFKDGVRQRTRILYVFRTPGGVRVGRDALEPEVQRQIEAQHPDIAFNWSQVRETQQIIETAVDPRRRRPKRDEEATPAAPVPPAAAVATVAPDPPRVQIPSAIAGTTPDEQIAFLTQWYPVIRERVSKRTSDPVRLEALGALAERLNPATWTDADQITTGLVAASEALERLAHVLAKRRRRARRRPAEARPGPAGESSPPPATES